MTTYAQYQELVVSEKIGLCVIEASKRLVGWTLHSGSIYKIEGIEFNKISSVVDSGSDYLEVSSIASVIAGSYYLDLDTKILYLRASDSSNPNSRFLVGTFELFFSNVPVIAPHDLSTGYDVEWLPLIIGSSGSGVEIENSFDQLGISIEGNYTVKLLNDKTYFGSFYDKVAFENKSMKVYSWSREIDITEAKLLFSGKIQDKSYNLDSIEFRAKDIFNDLREPIPLDVLGDIPNISIPLNFIGTKQRLIYGIVNGFRPQNIDQIVEGQDIELPFTVSGVSVDQITFNGTAATDWLGHYLLQGDKFRFEGSTKYYEVASIYSSSPNQLGRSLTTVETWDESEITAFNGKKLYAFPQRQVPYKNRVWKIAAHELREPEETITTVIGKTLTVSDSTDFDAGSHCFISGLNQNVTIDRIVSPTRIRIVETLTADPVGETIKRLSVFDVKINDTLLVHNRDYTYDAVNATLTLSDYAEANIAPTLRYADDGNEPIGYNGLGSNVSIYCSTGVHSFNRVTLGDYFWDYKSGTDNPSFLRICAVNSSATRELYSALLEDQGYLGGSPTPDLNGVMYKRPHIFDNSIDVLTCSVLGATDDGLKSGMFLRKAPGAVKDILTRVGLSAFLDVASFDDSEELLQDHDIGIAIPYDYSDRSTPSAREVINKINRSVFGVLFQSDNFELKYGVIRPKRDGTLPEFAKEDILRLSVLNTSDDTISRVVFKYDQLEYNHASKARHWSSVSKTSDYALYVIGTDKSVELESVLVTEYSATVMASRYKFIFERARQVLELETKMQGMNRNIIDSVSITHPLLPDRYGSVDKSRIMRLVSVYKDTFGSRISFDDLSFSLTRCAIITDVTTNYANSTEADRLVAGFITDSYGMQANDGLTHGLNLIW